MSTISIRAYRKSDIPALREMQQMGCDEDIYSRTNRLYRSPVSNWRMWCASGVVSAIAAAAAGTFARRFLSSQQHEQGAVGKKWALIAGLVTQAALSYVTTVSIPYKVYSHFSKFTTNVSGLDAEGSAAFVAVRDNDPESKPIAMICVMAKEQAKDNTARRWGWGTGCWEFQKVYVKPEARGQGLLKRLMDPAIAYVGEMDQERKEKAKRDGVAAKDFVPTRAVAATSDFATWEVIVPVFTNSRNGFKVESMTLYGADWGLSLLGKFTAHKLDKEFPGL